MKFLDRFISRKSTPCIKCASPARFGYSLHAESDRSQISSVCLSCLKAKLAIEFAQFDKRALVIEPAADFPCYVFQPSSRWKDSKLMRDVREMLSRMQNACDHCGGRANFLWLTSNGLRPDNQDELFSKGVEETLISWGNRPPHPVCAHCCVNRICGGIETHRLTFLEVCSPRFEEGLVLPMGY
jgi:hypothetical protein